MLSEIDAIVTIAVKDLKVARKFYEEVLALKPAGDNEMGTAAYRSGDSTILVYQSQFAGTNQATAVTWIVPNVEETVSELKSKGVVFEHYDFPGITRKGDVHVAKNVRNAWFKDPDGNIISLVTRQQAG